MRAAFSKRLEYEERKNARKNAELKSRALNEEKNGILCRANRRYFTSWPVRV